MSTRQHLHSGTVRSNLYGGNCSDPFVARLQWAVARRWRVFAFTLSAVATGSVGLQVASAQSNPSVAARRGGLQLRIVGSVTASTRRAAWARHCFRYRRKSAVEPRDALVRELAGLVRGGVPGRMPRFEPGQVSDSDIGALVDWFLFENSQPRAGRSFYEALGPATNTQSSDTVTYVAATKHTISLGFKQFYDQNGGAERFGNPLSEEYRAYSEIDGTPRHDAVVRARPLRVCQRAGPIVARSAPQRWSSRTRTSSSWTRPRDEGGHSRPQRLQAASAELSSLFSGASHPEEARRRIRILLPAAQRVADPSLRSG